MSHNARQSNADNKRQKNAAGAGDRRAPRVSTRENTTSASSFESRTQNSGANSPASGPERPTHKRTLSGNPRTNTMRPGEERERRTEKHTVTTRETLTSRVRSPERKRHMPSMSVPNDRNRAADSRRSAETRSKEPREVPPPPPWDPEATLLPHTSAPLASRISIPPLASQAPASVQPKPLSELSLEAQEAVILEDLLYVFMGYEGSYIRFGKGYDPTEERDRLSGPPHRILPGLDPSLQDLTLSMLKMATYYTALETFVDVQSREEFGSVNHALCASIRKFLQDYLVLIAQLETQFLTNNAFTLHVLNIHILPTSHMMFQLYSLAHELLKRNALLDDETDESSDSADDFDQILEQLRDGGELVPGNMTGKKICKGGVVLGLITKRLETMSGDPAARELLTGLLRDSSRPYMVMLNEWLHHGSINDPHGEFLIKEQRSLRRERLEQDYTDEYWERRYTIRDKEIPPQLVGVKDKVLLAGKYLNVVRECGGVDVSKDVKDKPKSFDDNRFQENVNSAYSHANESLMQLLLTTHALPDRLRSLKHYFFLDPSDYFNHFLELSASELRKPVQVVNIVKLQSLLDLVLRQPGSIVALDPFKEDVKVQMNEVTLIKSLQRVVNITGIEEGGQLHLMKDQPIEADKRANGFTSLQLDYVLPFPVSLVISRKTVWRYQALFRYLLSLRHLEAQLTVAWQVQTRGFVWYRRSSSPELELWKRRVWTLRARMLVFVQQLLYFCTAEVIEPNWLSLMSRLKAKDDGTSSLDRTVDELMQDHVDFLDTCLKECMLTNSKLLRVHSKLMNNCNTFTSSIDWITRNLERADPDLQGPNKPKGVTDEQWKQVQANKEKWQSAHGESSKTPEAQFAMIMDTLKAWEYNFGRHLKILLDALNHYAATETVVLLSLCARLSAASQGSEHTGMRTDDDSTVS